MGAHEGPDRQIDFVKGRLPPMIDRIRVYLEHAFANSPKTRRMEDLREELFSNLVEKYNDRVRQGMSEEDAYR